MPRCVYSATVRAKGKMKQRRQSESICKTDVQSHKSAPNVPTKTTNHTKQLGCSRKSLSRM